MENKVLNVQPDEVSLQTSKKVDLETMKTIYYLLNGQRDTDIKLYNKQKTFTKESIIDLNDRIQRKLSNHKVITCITKVVVGLNNNERKHFGIWDEFLIANWKIPAEVNFVIINWDFQITFPNQTSSFPQTHTIRVKLGNNLNPNEYFNALFVKGDDLDIEEMQSQTVCKIDFINDQLCSELQAIVSEWYDCLPDRNDNKKHKLYRLTAKYSNAIKHIIQILIYIAYLLLSYYYFDYFSINHNINNNIFFKFITGFVIILLIVNYLTSYLVNLVDKNMGKLKRPPMFQITSGDINASLKIIKRNNQAMIKIIIDIIIAITANIVASMLNY